MAFVEGRDVRPHVEAALGTAGLNLSLLERLREDTSEDRQRGFQLLRELDRGLMESSLLADLLVMSGLEPTSRVPGELGDLIVRLRSWLLAREAAPLAPGALAHVELHRRRLRALVHAIDGEGFPMWDETVSGTRERRLRALDRMLARLGAEPPSPLRRPVCAALARACEGLVRDELAEIGELVLLLGARLERPEDFIVLGEATVATELREVLVAVATLARRLREPADGEAALVAALSVLAEALPPGLSAPVEALRRSLLATARTLERVGSARSLLGLTVGRGTGWLDLLGGCVQDLAELSAGVWRRLNQPQRVVENIVGARPLQELDAAVAHAARGAPSADLDKVVKAAVDGVRADLPRLIGEVVTRALVRLPDLPERGARGGRRGPARVGVPAAHLAAAQPRAGRVLRAAAHRPRHGRVGVRGLPGRGPPRPRRRALRPQDPVVRRLGGAHAVGGGVPAAVPGGGGGPADLARAPQPGELRHLRRAGPPQARSS